MRRRRLAPEVVQTSAMDCGPACLKSVLEGFGIPVAYGPLREACQTDVDGTSIDAVEELATRLGLGAEQVMLPLDHLLLPEADALPAIVVVTAPDGFTHFVVAWSVVGPFVQLMDPALGRRWVRRERFLADVFVHSQLVPAAAWQAWTESEDFRRALRGRLRRLGETTAADRHLAAATGDGETMARTDAAVRLVTRLVDGGALARGSAAARAVAALVGDEDASALDDWRTARAMPDEEAEEPQVLMRGAVLVRLRPPEGPSSARTGEGLTPELRAALTTREARPLAELLRMLRADGWLRPAAVVAGIVLATLGILVEALVLRGVVDLGRDLVLPQQRWAAASALVLLLLVLLALELPLGASILGIGRRLELRFRVALLHRIPRLGDRYFATRPLSDLAERAHALHQLRDVGETGWMLTRALCELVLVSAGLLFLWPPGWPFVVALTLVSVGVPLLTNGPLREHDLRARTHLGALSRFYLDALLGLVPARAHGAERALAREHEGLLTEWVRASRARAHLAAVSEGAQLAAGLALGAWLTASYLAQAPAPGGALLLAYWAFRLPALGDEIALVARRYPLQRSILLRLAEPLGAVAGADDDGDTRAGGRPPTAAVAAPDRPCRIGVAGVHVVAGGNVILRDVSLSVAAGTHVAIVGASGAGKSTLLALLLGWQRPSDGEVLVDGVRLEGGHLDDVRRRTTWVDPGMQLWNRTLLENLLFGSGAAGLEHVAGAIEEAGLRAVLQQLPEGMASRLGEGGGLVSGGEGQRVRLARALTRGGAGLVLLDEPFRGFDHAGRREALRHIRRRCRASTLLYVTHDVRSTLDFERVLVMHDGEIVEDGAPGDLAARTGSRFCMLADAERTVAERLWESGAWRRVRLERGRIVEPPPDGALAPEDGARAARSPFT